VTERTVELYEQRLRLYIRPYIGGRRLKTLRRCDLENIVIALREQHLGARTIKLALDAFKTACQPLCPQWPDDPFAGLRLAALPSAVRACTRRDCWVAARLGPQVYPGTGSP